MGARTAVSPVIGTPVRFPLEPAPRVTGLASPCAARRSRSVGGDGTRVRPHGRAGRLGSMRRDARFRYPSPRVTVPGGGGAGSLVARLPAEEGRLCEEHTFGKNEVVNTYFYVLDKK